MAQHLSTPIWQGRQRLRQGTKPPFYGLRTIEGVTPLLQPLEDSIRQHFLPALTGQSGVSKLERELLALPARHGGLGLVNPATMSEEHTLSLRLTAPLTVIITLQRDDIGDSRQEQQSIKSSLHTERRKRQAAELKTRLPQHLQRAAELASEKGAYSWVIALQVAAHGFALHKMHFVMHSAFATTAHQLICQECVFAVQLSPQTMHSHVQPEESQSFGTMKYTTSPPASSPRYAMTCVLNHACKHC